MRSSAWALVICVLAWAWGCESDPDSEFVYGPCDRCGNGATLQSSDGTCLCARLCHVGEPCPQPLTGDVEATCVDQGDVINNGFDGRCDLPCSADATCPDDSECISGVCRYRQASNTL